MTDLQIPAGVSPEYRAEAIRLYVLIKSLPMTPTTKIYLEWRTDRFLAMSVREMLRNYEALVRDRIAVSQMNG